MSDQSLSRTDCLQAKVVFGNCILDVMHDRNLIASLAAFLRAKYYSARNRQVCRQLDPPAFCPLGGAITTRLDCKKRWLNTATIRLIAAAYTKLQKRLT